MSRFSNTGSYIVSNSNQNKKYTAELIQPITQKNYIEEANRIMRERMKNKGSTINSKSRLKSVIINDTKEISLKNYLIDLLKCERTDINEKERSISDALINSAKALDKDNQKFMEYVEKEKKAAKDKEEKSAQLKKEKLESEKKLSSLEKEQKSKEEEKEKIIRNIVQYINYGKFINRVINEDFKFEGIDDLINYETHKKEQAILNCKKWDKIVVKPDEDLIKIFYNKFSELEAKIRKQIKERDQNIKEQIEEEDIYIKEDQELNQRNADYLNDINLLKTEIVSLEKKIDSMQIEKKKKAEESKTYIIELLNNISSEKLASLKRKKDNEDNVLAMAEMLQDDLKEKEKRINDYLVKLLQLHHKDPAVFDKVAFDRKNENKQEKVKLQKERKRIEDEKKKQKAIARSEKVIIKGRQVPKEYPIKKLHKKKKVENVEEDRVEDLLFYDDD